MSGTLYKVMWEIELEADTAEDAARQALNIQRDPESIALLFDVENTETGELDLIDLLDCEDE